MKIANAVAVLALCLSVFAAEKNKTTPPAAASAVATLDLDTIALSCDEGFTHSHVT